MDPVLTKKDTFFSHELQLPHVPTFLQIPMNAFLYLFNLLMVFVVPSELGIHVVCFVFVVLFVYDCVGCSLSIGVFYGVDVDKPSRQNLFICQYPDRHYLLPNRDFHFSSDLCGICEAATPAKNTKSFLKDSPVLAHILKMSAYSYQTVLH